MYRSILRLFSMETAGGQRQKACREITGMPQGSKNVERICEEAWRLGINI